MKWDCVKNGELGVSCCRLCYRIFLSNWCTSLYAWYVIVCVLLEMTSVKICMTHDKLSLLMLLFSSSSDVCDKQNKAIYYVYVFSYVQISLHTIMPIYYTVEQQFNVQWTISFWTRPDELCEEKMTRMMLTSLKFMAIISLKKSLPFCRGL